MEYYRCLPQRRKSGSIFSSGKKATPDLLLSKSILFRTNSQRCRHLPQACVGRFNTRLYERTPGKSHGLRLDVGILSPEAGNRFMGRISKLRAFRKGPSSSTGKMGLPGKPYLVKWNRTAPSPLDQYPYLSFYRNSPGE